MSAPASRILLIGWDAADWKMINPLLEAGRMPNLERFISGGVMGNIASLSPMLSPILWTSIATGKNADKHQILGFCEPDDATGNIRPVTSTSRKCKAIWNILSSRDKRAGVFNWFASHPAEQINGFVVTDRYPHAGEPLDKPWPVPPASIHPANLAEKVGALRLHPALTAPDLIERFVPALRSDKLEKDERIHNLRCLLAQTSSIHNAATYFMQEQPWDFVGIYYDAIDRIGHAFMEYHAPKMAHVSDEDFEHFKEVMNACYVMHDMMLGRLLQLAGDDATVIIVSDHGFHSDHLRPVGSAKIKDGQPVSWHRSHGVFAAKGPRIKRDQRVYGATLLDITPTALWLMGLPVAKDMDGHVLTQIVDGDAPPVERIDSYEDGTTAAVADVTEDPWVIQRTLAQLAALGYIDSNKTEDIAIDRLRNLAQVYLGTQRPRLAIEQYRAALELKPDDPGSKIGLARAFLLTGETAECERIIAEILSRKEDAPIANYFQGVIAFRRGDIDGALRYLRRAERSDAAMPGLHSQIGQVFLRRRRWQDAARMFRKAIAADPDNAESHDGYGVALRRLGRPHEAVREHMLSIGLQHFRPLTHIHLGLALAQVGEVDWAIRAFQVAIEQHPANPLPHRCLAQVYSHLKEDPILAAAHRRYAQDLIRRRAARRQIPTA